MITPPGEEAEEQEEEQEEILEGIRDVSLPEEERILEERIHEERIHEERILEEKQRVERIHGGDER